MKSHYSMIIQATLHKPFWSIDPIPTLHPRDGLQVKFQQLAA